MPWIEVRSSDFWNQQNGENTCFFLGGWREVKGIEKTDLFRNWFEACQVRQDGSKPWKPIQPFCSMIFFMVPRYTRHEYSLLKVLEEQLDDGSLARINTFLLLCSWCRCSPMFCFCFFPDVESLNQRSCHEKPMWITMITVRWHLQTCEIYVYIYIYGYILICSQTLHYYWL